MISDSESTTYEAAGVEPNLTALTLVKSLPAMVTVVPPPAGPLRLPTRTTRGAGCTSALKPNSRLLTEPAGDRGTPSSLKAGLQ